jgi:hypothetical protein
MREAQQTPRRTEPWSNQRERNAYQPVMRRWFCFHPLFILNYFLLWQRMWRGLLRRTEGSMQQPPPPIDKDFKNGIIHIFLIASSIS